jgi:hypothetical protein
MNSFHIPRNNGDTDDLRSLDLCTDPCTNLVTVSLDRNPDPYSQYIQIGTYLNQKNIDNHTIHKIDVIS